MESRFCVFTKIFIFVSRSVIRLKAESQNRCYKKRTRHAYQGVRFGVLCFLLTPVLRFVLLPYCQRVLVWTFLYTIWKYSEADQRSASFSSVVCNLVVYSQCFTIIKYMTFLGSIWNGIVTGLLTSTYTYFSTCYHGLSGEVS